MALKILQAQNYEFNRKAIEQKKCNTLVFPAKTAGKDRPKQLDSGLDHVVAAIAKKNKVAIALDLSILQKMSKEDKASALARFKQNLKLCKKAGAPIKILNSEDKIQARALLLTLGASTRQAKEAISF